MLTSTFNSSSKPGQDHSSFVLDATQGTTIFAYQDTAKDSTFDGAATIAHGILYIGNLDGTLFAFTLASE